MEMEQFSNLLSVDFAFSFVQAEKYVKVNQVFKKLDKYNSE